MIFLVTLFTVHLSFCVANLKIVCIMHISFINKTLYTMHLVGFLSIEQSTALLLGHNKTPALTG